MTTRSRSRKVSRAWLHDHVNDPYVKLAQREGYRARAAYKLKEIDETLHLLKPGQVVVDLGAAPGAWSQYVRRRVAQKGAARPATTLPESTARDAASGPARGILVALDLLPLEPIEGVLFVHGDFREEAVLARLEAALGGRAVDVVLSDMAPNLSGIPASDAARMADLVELAIDFARRHLVPRGALVCKVFHGSGYSQLVERFKAVFQTVKPVKPKASRDRSAETFLVGIGLRAPASTSEGRP